MAAKLRRLVQLWGLYGRLDLLYVARGPKTALTYYASDLIVGLAAVTATFLLAERFNGIGVWSKHQVIFLLGFALLVRGAINMLFNYNLAHISRKIGRGQLDHMLIQPQPLWMGLITEGFAPWTGAGMFVPGLALLWWSTSQLQMQISAAWLALVALYLLCSMAITLAFSYAWGSLAFWAPRAAEEINSTTWRLLTQLNVFPLDGLPALALTGLLAFVPAGFLAWYPSRVLLGLSVSGWDWLVPPLAALLFVALGAGIFARGLHHYDRTGSSRYLSWGHRS
jgi:ABC-2 type transport system permease protein